MCLEALVLFYILLDLQSTENSLRLISITTAQERVTSTDDSWQGMIALRELSVEVIDPLAMIIVYA